MLYSADSETTGLDLHHSCRPFMFSTFDGKKARVWRWNVDPFTRVPQIPSADKDAIAHHLTGCDLVFHNAIFDLRALATIGIYLSFSAPRQMLFQPPRSTRTTKHAKWVVKCGELHDTQLLSHTVRSDGAGGSHALKDLCFYYFDYLNDDQRAIHQAAIAARRTAKQLGWKLGTDLHGAAAVDSDYWLPRAVFDEFDHPHSEEEIDRAWKDLAQKYNVGDCERTLALHYFLQEIMVDEHPSIAQSYERELRLLPVTYRMENHGMAISKSRLTEQTNSFVQQSEDAKRTAEGLIKQHWGLDVNINSGPQLTEWLAAAHLPLYKRTKTGYSTDAQTLTNLAQYAEAHGPNFRHVAAILRLIVGHDEDLDDERTSPGYQTYVGGARFLSSYTDFLIGTRLHPSFNQAGTKFTRYSCSNPNGQNISTQAVLPLRRVYGPPSGHLWFDPDYSQIELRIFAHVAQDTSMQEAFVKGYDFHIFTASRLYRLPQEKITKEQKRVAKGINFKAIYGGINNVPEEYSRQFPRAAAYMGEIEARVRELGYVETIQGDRIYIDSEKPYVGVDAICQGSAGRVIKDAMTMLHETGVVDWDGCSIIGNIHDQLIIEVSRSYPILRLARKIKKIMELAGSMYGVSTPVEMTVVRESWDNSEKLNLCKQLV